MIKLFDFEFLGAKLGKKITFPFEVNGKVVKGKWKVNEYLFYLFTKRFIKGISHSFALLEYPSLCISGFIAAPVFIVHSGKLQGREYLDAVIVAYSLKLFSHR